MSEADIDDDPCDFPQLLPGGRRVVVTRPSGTNFTASGGVSVVDLQTGAREDHAFGDGRYGGELLPIGEVNGRTLIAGLVHDVARDAAELLVLDADDLGAGPVARLLLPVRVPFGLHGAWLAGV